MSKLRSLTINPRCLYLCTTVDSPLRNLENQLNQSHSVIDGILIQPNDYGPNEIDGCVPNSIRIMIFYTEHSESYVPFEFILWEKEQWDNYEDNFGTPNDNSDYLPKGCTVYQRGKYNGIFMTRKARTK